MSAPAHQAALAGVLLLLAPVAASDEIRRTNGGLIEDVEILEENLTTVSYKSGRIERSISADEVLTITYSSKPKAIDAADTAFAEGDYITALETYDDFVAGFLEGRSQRKKWSPGYAAWMAVEVQMALGDLPGAVKAGTRIVERLPDSRFVPQAYIARANAYLWQGMADEAQASLQPFRKLIEERGLSRRWDLECQLALLQTESTISGVQKRDALALLQGEAGSAHPTVRNRARVSEGESYLEESEGLRDDAGTRLELVGKARAIFEQILADFNADEETLAGAYTGLGSCMFMEAMRDPRVPDPELLRSALHCFLRVTVLYKDQARYLPKAIYSAGLCFDVLDEKLRAGRMYRFVLREFPGNQWSERADKKLNPGG